MEVSKCVCIYNYFIYYDFLLIYTVYGMVWVYTTTTFLYYFCGYYVITFRSTVTHAYVYVCKSERFILLGVRKNLFFFFARQWAVVFNRLDIHHPRKPSLASI